MTRVGYTGGFSDYTWGDSDVHNLLSTIPVNGTFTMPEAGYINDYAIYAAGDGANVAAEMALQHANLGAVVAFRDFTIASGSRSVGGQAWQVHGGLNIFAAKGTQFVIVLWRAESSQGFVWSWQPGTSYQYDDATEATAPSQGGVLPSTHDLNGGDALGAYFDYTPAAPIIASASQNNATPGTTIALYGNAFTGVSAVSLGGVACSFSVISDTQLNVTIPSGQYYQSTFAVTNAYGTSTSSFAFTTDYAPTITSVSPGNGPVGTNVVLSGYLMATTSAVYFNGVGAVFSVQSDNQITATVPSGAVTGPITVATAYGSTNTASFTVNYPPSISNVTPSPAPPGTSVTITGAYFVGATSVKFNGVNATSFTVNSQTSLTATVPSNAGSGSPLTVTTPYGTATYGGFTSSQTYSYDGTTWQETVSNDSFDGSAQQQVAVLVFDGTTWQQIG